MPIYTVQECSMSINNTSFNGNVNTQELVTDEKASLKVTQLKELQTNIGKEIGTNFFTMVFNYVFHHGRTVTLKNLNEKLNSGVPPERAWLTDSLPEKTQELFRRYLSLFIEPEKDFKNSLTQEEFQQIWDGKQNIPIGQGGFGTVYQSAGGKYALKVANRGKSIADDTTKNKALKHNAEAFDPHHFYYKENDGLITKYVGTFKTDNGMDVAVFEKINGKDFSTVNACSPAYQCQLLAQAATAIAISHEAGCINSDIKPQNMMVSTDDPRVLKLIDQGGLIDLTKGIPENISYTAKYSAPELGRKFSPAYDVFSLGVTISEKLLCYSNNTKVKDTIRDIFSKGPINEDRIFLSENIGRLFETKQLFGTPEESKFLGLLLKDCLAYKPEDRISAAQAAEILQVFSTYLENPDMGCPDYENVKALAIQDCPKGIPIALRKMLFSEDKSVRNNAVFAIKNLVKADPSYKNTPSYGVILLLSEQGENLLNNELLAWAQENPEALQQLKERTYISGNEHTSKQDMPVSESFYRRIQELS